MKTITCKLPEKLDAQLEAAAQEEGISKSQVVRNALEDRISRKRGKKSPRAYDLVKNLSGSVKGPADLLTDPKYMENFGA
jgi:Arc/MetJ-type ribon-helix-helix transcriptional regulator